MKKMHLIFFLGVNIFIYLDYQNPQNNFRAYANPQAIDASPSREGNQQSSGHTSRQQHFPQPMLKRPGKATFGSSVRIGSLGLPVSQSTGRTVGL